MRKSAALIICILLTSLAATRVAAQESGSSGLASRRLLLSVSREQGTQLTANEEHLIARAILMRLQQASTEYIVIESEDTTSEEAALSAAAQAVGADCWLSIDLGGDWQALTLRVRSFDLLSNAVAVDLTLNRAEWTSARDLSLETWDDLTGPVAEHYRGVAAIAAAAAQPRALLTVMALPGTVIAGLGEPLVIGDDGVVIQEMPTTREYTLRASLRGHAFVKQSIFLTADRLITLSQAADPRWSLDTTLQDNGNPGLDLTWNFIPGGGFLRLGASTCLLGIGLDGESAFTSAPLSMARLQLGMYLTQEDMRLDLYAGIEGFLRVVHEDGTEPALDAISPGGVQIVVGAEIPLSTRVRLFVEYTPTQYITYAPELLQAALGAYTPPGWTFYSSSAINYLSARIGCRWAL